MIRMESDNDYQRDMQIIAQSLCIKIIDECKNGMITTESIDKLSNFVNCDLMSGKLEKTDLSKLCRIIFGVAYKIMKESMKSVDGFNHFTVDSALRIINDVFEHLNFEDARDLCSFFWFINNRCLLLGEKKISNMIELEKIVRFPTNFVNFMLSDAINRKDFFSKDHRGELAFMITFFISKFSSQLVDLPVRLSIGNALLEFVKPREESVKTVEAFLPGICGSMAKLTCNDLNTTVVGMALEILDCTITTCLNDSVTRERDEVNGEETGGNQQENSENIPQKSDENTGSIEKRNEKLKLLLTRMSARLVRHRDHRIRFKLLNVLNDIYENCAIILGCLIENALIDAVLLLLSDPYEEIAAFSKKIKGNLLQTAKDSFVNRLRERLYSLSIGIPNEVIVRGDVKGCFDQLLGVMLSIDDSECNDILLGGKLPEQLTFALSSALRLNVKRLRLSSEVTEKSDILGILDDLPLLQDMEKKTISHIARLLVKNKQSYILLNCISTNVGHLKRPEELTDNYHFAAYLLRAACADTAVKPAEKFIDALQLLVEQAVILLERIDIHRPPRDDLIEDDYDEHGAESCLVTVLLAFCAAAFTCTPSIFLCQKLMNETLFELFKWTKSSYVMCAESAENALKAAALAAGEADTSSLCVTYGKYLLPKIAICSRTYSSNLRTPCVLSSLLDHCNSAELFVNTRHVVDELLLAIDLGSQEWLILILRAILSYAKAIGKWFPDIKPQEIEFDENDPDKKAPKPDFVESVDDVLKRTKHLLFSSHVPIRLLILKILDVCLRDLQHFPDDYLPMIHQNWPSVLDCLRDKNLNVRLAGFQIIVTMCELSGSFCYRRFIPQAWPSICKFMLEQSASSENARGAYFHSAAYKFQKIVLENLAVVFQHIEARHDDWRSAVEVAKAYCSVSQPKNLQIMSKSLLSACERKLEKSDDEPKV